MGSSDRRPPASDASQLAMQAELASALAAKMVVSARLISSVRWLVPAVTLLTIAVSRGI